MASELQKEVLGLLKKAPMCASDLFDKCEQAENEKQLSNALYYLGKQKGLVQRDADGLWSLTESGAAAADGDVPEDDRLAPQSAKGGVKPIPPAELRVRLEARMPAPKKPRAADAATSALPASLEKSLMDEIARLKRETAAAQAALDAYRKAVAA